MSHVMTEDFIPASDFARLVDVSVRVVKQHARIGRILARKLPNGYWEIARSERTKYQAAQEIPIRHFAELLGVNFATAKRWWREGRLAGRRLVSGYLVVPASEVERIGRRSLRDSVDNEPSRDSVDR